jgi:hypothetical protein
MQHTFPTMVTGWAKVIRLNTLNDFHSKGVFFLHILYLGVALISTNHVAEQIPAYGGLANRIDEALQYTRLLRAKSLNISSLQ